MVKACPHPPPGAPQLATTTRTDRCTACGTPGLHHRLEGQACGEYLTNYTPQFVFMPKNLCLVGLPEITSLELENGYSRSAFLFFSL